MATNGFCSGCEFMLPWRQMDCRLESKSDAEIFAGTARRATLNKMPTQASMATMLDPP